MFVRLFHGVRIAVFRSLIGFRCFMVRPAVDFRADAQRDRFFIAQPVALFVHRVRSCDLEMAAVLPAFFHCIKNRQTNRLSHAGRNGEMPPQAVVVAGGERCLAIVPKFHDVVSETDRYAEARHHHLAVRRKIRRRAGGQERVVFALQFSPACTGLDITA